MTGQPGWVLIVADEATERMLLFRMLERAGYHATVTDNAAEASQLLRAEPFDVVILSLSRSDPDTYTTLATLQRDRELRQVPVIVVAGADETEGAPGWVQLGADDWMVRPCDPTLLQARVAASADKRRLRQREAEYLDLKNRVAALIGPGAEAFDQTALELLTHRPDALGDLARVIQHMAAELDRLRRQVTASSDARQ